MFRSRLAKRILSGLSAVVMLACDVLPLSPMFAIAEDETASVCETEQQETQLLHQSFELYPNGEESEQTVTLEGLMPEGSSAEAVDVTEMFAESDRVPEELSSVIAAYDITIADGETEYQPGEESPIYVEIADPGISEGSPIELWHIADNGEREQITDFTVTDGMIGFYATGFSVYAIVEAPAPVEYNEPGWYQVMSTSLLDVHSLDGIYISTDGGIFMKGNQIAAGGITGRTGIEGTENCGSDADAAIEAGAVPFYFEKTSSNKYYIYCLDGENKKYIYNNTSKKALGFVDALADATQFSISCSNGNVIISNGNNYKWQFPNDSGAFVTGSNAATLVLQYYIKPTPDDVYELGGNSYGLMLYTGGAYGTALLSEAKSSTVLKSQDILTKTNPLTHSGINFVSTEDDIVAMWEFANIREDIYTLSTTVGEDTKYLVISGSGVSLTDDPASASEIKVTPGTGTNAGKVRLSAENTYLNCNGSNGFNVVTNPGASSWLNLAEMTQLTNDDFIVYSAQKVGVAEKAGTPAEYIVKDKDKIILYTRVWDDTKKRYDFYAVDHDGTLVPCYERGNSIMWIGSKINTLLWEFTEYYYAGTDTPNYYYELYNPYSRKFIAPQIMINQILSDSKIGINLDGRREDGYYTTIQAWDDPNYSYAGVKTENGRIVPCPRGESETFYFAVMEPHKDTLTEVETVDNNEYGITMKMVDFNNGMIHPNNADTDPKQHEILGNSVYSDKTVQAGLVSASIPEGKDYPDTLLTNKSLSDLFGVSESQAVNHLFLKSTYEATGYFEFDSCQNYALLGNDGNFTVYKELGTHDASKKESLQHGQFFPYDDFEPEEYTTINKENLYDALKNPLPESDPRKYEKLHKIMDPDYFFGMELGASFVQTPDGKDAWGHDVIFEFTGDDDFWLYVDNELVIDLGGIHGALSGNVNFATGEVVVNSQKTNLRTIFSDHYRAKYIAEHPDAATSEIDAAVAAYEAETFVEGKNKFKNYSAHTMKIFYMERGAGASNLHMRFNLSYVTPGSVMMTKEVSNVEGLDYSVIEYPYQIYYQDENNGSFKRLNNANDHISVSYLNPRSPATYKPTYTIAGVEYEDIYFLHPGKSVAIDFPADTIQYYIKEVGVNSEVYSTVLCNDQQITNVDNPEDPDNPGHPLTTTRKEFSTQIATVSDRPTVVLDNVVDPTKLKTLTIEKRLYDVDGNLVPAIEDGTTFDFRLELSNEYSDELVPTYMHKYYVESNDGKLCRWDSASQKFVRTDYTNYDSLSDAQKATVTFDTSIRGAISKIPAGFKVKVPDLFTGTKFKVEEKEDEVPLGYRRGYNGVIYARLNDGSIESYNIENGDPVNVGRIIDLASPSIAINNQQGFGLKAEKVWSDEEYTESHDPVYFAVYVKGALLAGSVKEIAHPNTTAIYFFDKLEPDCTLSDYVIREVKLTGTVTTDSEGNVTSYETITPVVYNEAVENSDMIEVSATPKGENAQSETFRYKVSYNQGKISGKIGNARTDTVTNTAEDGLAVRLFKWNSDVPLAGGDFVLKLGDVVVNTYTSDKNGKITILYNFKTGQNYTLEQISAPQGYIGLAQPITFSVEKDTNVITLTNPNGTGWAMAGPDSSGAYVGLVDVFNKPFTLKAYKLDSSTDDPLSGAHFTLYRGVDGSSGKTVKDYYPMTGFEDLVSDEEGVIPKIDETHLEPGIYFLTETAAPADHIGLDSDLEFEITLVRQVVILSEGHESFLVKDETGDPTVISINVPNAGNTQTSKLTIIKDVEGSMGNKNKEFTFKVEIDGAAESDRYSWKKNGEKQSEALASGGTFKLKDGERVDITLPTGKSVTVTETGAEGYDTVFTLDNNDPQAGSSLTFTLNKNSELTVRNTMEAVIPTGIKLGVTACCVLFLITAAGIILLRKKYRDDGEDE